MLESYDHSLLEVLLEDLVVFGQDVGNDVTAPVHKGPKEQRVSASVSSVEEDT